MSEPFIIFLIGSISALAGAYVGNLIARLKAKSESGKLEERLLQLKDQEEKLNERFENVLHEREVIRKEKDFLNEELVRRNAENQNLEVKLNEQKNELGKMQEKFTVEFENLANKILETKSEKFTKQNAEKLDLILKPLHEKIKSVEKKVDDTQKESISMHSSLKEQLIGLKDLNLQMSKEAINLTNALKGDSKVQGDWGETQLEILLEKVGLKKGIHFSAQGGYRDGSGNLKKPDFIINLPDKKHLVVDSKVSLTAYEGFYSAKSDEEKSEHLKKHF